VQRGVRASMAVLAYSECGVISRYVWVIKKSNLEGQKTEPSAHHT
jgi:hypothetical protein